MDPKQAGRFWNEAADAWTAWARAGSDLYRDHFNTPAFFDMLPAVEGLRGLDIGCGEGHNTRLLARRGARVSAIDIAERFIFHASARERREPLGIDYQVASATALPFPDGSFDFAISCMSLMDVPQTDGALAQAFRVLRPGGFLQFSICHPCFDTPHRRNLRRNGRTYAFEVGDYFRRVEGEAREWVFAQRQSDDKDRWPRYSLPRFHRPLGEWLNLLIEKGFVLRRVGEPRPDDETVQRVPKLQDAQVVAYFLHFLVEKPAGLDGT